MRNRILVTFLIGSLILYINPSFSSPNENELLRSSPCPPEKYSFLLKPYESMKIYSQNGDAANLNTIFVYINSILWKSYNNRYPQTNEYQNTTPDVQFVEIRSPGLHFIERNIGDNTLQLSYEDGRCIQWGGKCRCGDNDFNDAYLFIKKF
jgi:hypothetical protein